jgi:hypothetical protein
MSDYDYESEEPEERPRDIKVDDVKLVIANIFLTEPERVLYSAQIETRLEREYFHWIRNKGLIELRHENKNCNVAASYKQRAEGPFLTRIQLTGIRRGRQVSSQLS